MTPAGWQRVALLAAIALQAGFTASVALTRLNTFKSSVLDIGVFQQFYMMLAQGLPPVSSINLPEQPMHWLGFHFSPILYAFLPLHMLYPEPLTLILLQSIAMASAAWFVFKIALLLTGNATHALLWAILFLANPYLINAAAGDFHEICFAVPLIAGVCYFLLSKKFYGMTACLLLVVLTKEHYGLAMVGAGIAWIWRYQDYRRGLPLVCVGIALLIMVMAVIMPWFADEAAHPMLSTGDRNLGRYGWLGWPWPQKIDLFLQMMMPGDNSSSAGLRYLMMLFGSAGFVCLISPWLLLPALADLAANMLSSNVMPRDYYAYHSAAIVPVLFAASIYAVQSYTINARLFFVSLFAVLGVFHIQTNPLKYWQIERFVFAKPELLPHDILTSIEVDAPISIQPNLGGHLLEQYAVYTFPGGISKSDFVLLHLEYPYQHVEKEVFSMPYSPLTGYQYIEKVRYLLKDKAWCVAYWEAPTLLLKRETCSVRMTQDQQKEVEARLGALGNVAARLTTIGK